MGNKVLRGKQAPGGTRGMREIGERRGWGVRGGEEKGTITIFADATTPSPLPRPKTS